MVILFSQSIDILEEMILSTLFSGAICLSNIGNALGCNEQSSNNHHTSDYTNIDPSFDPTSETNLDMTFRILSWDRNYVLSVHPKNGDAYAGDPLDLDVLSADRHSNDNEVFRYANGYLILDSSIVTTQGNCTKVGAFVLSFTNYYDNILELQWVSDITQGASTLNQNMSFIRSEFGWIICNGNKTICLGFAYAGPNDSILTGIDYHHTIETNMHVNWLLSPSVKGQKTNSVYSDIPVHYQPKCMPNQWNILKNVDFDSDDLSMGRFRIVTSDGNFVLCSMGSYDDASMYLIQILDNTPSRRFEGFSLHPFNTQPSYNSRANLGSKSLSSSQSSISGSYIVQDLGQALNGSFTLGIFLNEHKDGIRLFNFNSTRHYASQQACMSRLTFYPTKYQNGTFYLCTGDPADDSRFTETFYSPNLFGNYTGMNNISVRYNMTHNHTDNITGHDTFAYAFTHPSDYRKYPPSTPRECLAHDPWGNLYLIHDKDLSSIGPEGYWSLTTAMLDDDSSSIGSPSNK